MELRPMVSSTTSSSELSPSEIGVRNWSAAEKAVSDIIQKVQPTSVTEDKRREVIEYIQRLIRNCLGAELFPYGSVPLKTFLPDGDIDLTAFGGSNVEDSLADIILSVLEEEEKSVSAEFVVKDVQLIRAEVKIVKCIVQNIVVDVSVNQIGGLCTLCFLEQIDRLIGKDHLFKRSIILIKAWCYYESRILGAHHGLISTYALETLVLYIFNLFHSTLDGPLAVLYKFLDYFSKFDWETYCISLNGPIRLSLLPAMEAELPEDGEKDLLLTRDFLSSCVDMFSVPSRGGDQNSRGFQRKHLNIVDPLKENNNLGRSVSKGNFYRVRSAFSYGARKLGKILAQPENSIANELHKFFSNTMGRQHGGGQRHDVRDSDPSLTSNRSEDLIEGLEKASKVDHRLLGDANDLATSGIGGLNISVHSEKTPIAQESVSAGVDKPLFLPHLHFQNSKYHSSENSKSSASSERRVDEIQSGSNDEAEKTCSSSGESLNNFSNLAGDYDSYLQCLQYGRWCYEHAIDVHSLHIPPYQNNNNPPSQFIRNGFVNQHHNNGFHPNPAMFALRPVLMPFGWDGIPKARGTGTYFPNMNQPPSGYRPSAGEGRILARSRSAHNHARNMIFKEPNRTIIQEANSPQTPQVLVEQNPIVGNSADNYPPPFSLCGNGYLLNPNIPAIQPEEIEYGLVGPASGNSIVEKTMQQPVSSSPRNLPGTPKSPPPPTVDKDRISLSSSYHLKDEDDFPRLSV